jgi:predicted ATPase
MLTEIADPERAPEILAMRERIRTWRCYDCFGVSWQQFAVTVS